MSEVLDFSVINPFSRGEGSMLGMGAILLIIFFALVIIGLIGALIWIFVVKKNYWIKIHVYRLIGNIPTRVAIYQAREVPFGMAGDKLWKVAVGLFKKPVKWLPVGKIQTAPKEFWYYIREDGEWINFQMDNLDEVSKKAMVRFVQEDMRLQRLATERLLEQRLMDKSFWERWQTVIMTVIFFLVIAVCMVIIFYQFSKLLEEFSPLVSRIADAVEITSEVCRAEGGGTLLPVN